MIKLEIKKAFNNFFFFSSLGCSLLIAILSAIRAVRRYFINTKIITTYEPDAYTYLGSSLYNNWLGSSGDFYTHLFYFLIFLLCTLPYSWSLFVEKKSGYINQVVTRTSRANYYLSKYLAAFVSGGAIAFIPLVMNFLICALFIPAYPMDQLSDLYIAVPQNYLWATILYDKPLVYVVMYMFLTFVFCGVWATIGVSLSFVLKSKLSVLISPFLFILLVQVFSGSSFYSSGKTIIPSYLIAPKAYGYGCTTEDVVVTWLLAVLLFDVAIYILKGYKKDVI